MNGFCDIHAHVLPGIDDGPRDLEQSVEMLRSAAASGTAMIAATPHLRSDFPHVHVGEIGGRCRELADRARAGGIEVQVVPGAEVSLMWALDAGDEDLALASYGQRGTDLLIETPLVIGSGLNVALHEITRRGFRVTLAHPERTREFQDDLAGLTQLLHEGILIQINADTLVGDPRKSRACRLGRRLCAEGIAHVLASDGHRADSWRPITSLAVGVEAAAALVGSDRAEWMSKSVPEAVLTGRQLPPEPPITVPASSRRLRMRRRPSARG